MKRFATAAIILASAAVAMAGDVLHWQDNSLTALYGQKYRVNPDTQYTLTFEHASGWNVGDLFFFVDGTYYDGDEDFYNGKEAYYGEFSPRLSAGKLSKKDLSLGFVKDWLVAFTYEYGENDVESYLPGVGVDLDIPGFNFFQLNAYYRIPENSRDGETIQITPVWKTTIPMGESSVVCDGFIDWVVNSDGDYEQNLHICPQVKLDIGAYMGMEAGSLLAGIEYDYWKNKYGVEDSDDFKTDQNTFSGLIQYHF